MHSLAILLLIIAAISTLSIAAIRLLFKIKIDNLSEELKYITPYNSAEHCIHNPGLQFIDIETEINNIFKGHTIYHSEEINFTEHYTPIFNKICSLLKWLETFHIEPSDIIAKFASDFNYIHQFVEQHNERITKNLLDINKEFFDNCLQYPLDEQQRRSILSDGYNCLVISSAGSGKTSSIIGKVKYLTTIKGASPERICLISYTNKAATELTERMSTIGIKGYTFHKLATDIIAHETGEKPSICDNTDALFATIYHELSQQSSYKKHIVELLLDHESPQYDFEIEKAERREQLSEQKSQRLKALFPNMDGRTIYVKSKQEQKICFVLSSLGVRFRYEEPYEYPLANEFHSQYKPDFSIYYNKDGVTKRIYLEHFGIDEHGFVPMWFAKDNNITYEEANQKYNDGITWKKAAHNKFGTTLLTTSSADFSYSDIKSNLKNLLRNAGVPIYEMSDGELYESILPKNSKQEKALIRLVATFITLTKSSCQSIYDILNKAVRANDERSEFIIRNIFIPVYEKYVRTLKENNQLDFTDFILKATDIYRYSHPAKYDYIIVDEFQDISIDRYNFLKALRDGNPPAKLYCVGDDWQSIYRFSGSDMALFNQFPNYFGETEIARIETTYRFGEPLVSLSSQFIQRNNSQIAKRIRPFNTQTRTDLEFYSYSDKDYCNLIGQIIAKIPSNKSIILLGRYSFDDYYLSFTYRSSKRGTKFFYHINNREIEFLTVHKSKGLEADYVILLQCNKDIYGFPSLINDDPVLNYVLTTGDQFPFGEERRLFYVAITRAKTKTFVLYDRRSPSVFVDEFLHPDQISTNDHSKHPNANKRWTLSADKYLLMLHKEGKSIPYIATKMGRSQTSIVMRLEKLSGENGEG